MRLDDLLAQMRNLGASTLHLASGERPRARRGGILRTLEGVGPLSGDEVQRLIEDAAGGAWTAYETHPTLDFAYTFDGARYRVHCFQCAKGPTAIVRTTPAVLDGAALGLPPEALRLAHLMRGLVVVAGPSGSGRSTTVAALVEDINATHVKHVVSVERPIEFVHQERRSMFSQREVGEHVRNHALGLRTALTISPDVIVAGELESEEAIDAAFAAAEAGVLVFATVPANGVVRALERLLSHFPDERRARASRRLAEALGAVVSQLLLPAAGDNGRVLAAEVLVRGRTLGALIREGKLDAVESIMRRSEVMQTMDEALARLVSSRLIRPEDAYDHARDKTLFAHDNPRADEP